MLDKELYREAYVRWQEWSIVSVAIQTAHIEEWLGQFAEVLQKPELLSEFRRALSKMQKR